MLRLFTFGGLGLEFDNGSSAPRLRRPPLAMLAVLAAAGDRGVSRERLASLFWPESDEEHARHSARQVLYALRQELGADVVRSIGSNLSLDPAAITTDVAEFRAAIAAGDRERAVGLVRGPFLEAFYLPGASAFERWMEEERSRLGVATTAALVALASEATRLQRLDAAVGWWHQLTTLEPLSGRFAVGYLKALAVRGDRAEALAFARQHEQTLRRELEAEPDPDVRRLEVELRAMPSQPTPAATDNGGHSVQSGTNGSHVPAVTAIPVVLSAPNASGEHLRWTPRRRVIVLAGAAAMLLLVVTVVFARQLGWFRPVSALPTLAVGLIRDDGVTDSIRSGQVLTDMLATSLARVNGLRVLANSRLLELMRASHDSAAGYADAARRAGATELIEGQLYPASVSGLTLEVRRVDLRSGIVNGVHRVSAANRYALVDSLTQLLAGQLQLASPAGSIADATTTSLVAYRFYEEGLRAYYQGDAKAAQRLMRAALVEDSTFAMAAWYEASLAGGSSITPDGRHVADARRTALRLARHAPDRERLTITANVLHENQEPSALAVAESLNVRYPDDPRALMTLARVRSAMGDWPGSVTAVERAIAIDSTAEIDVSSICRMCDDFLFLSELYFWWDSLAATQRTARRLLAARPTAYGALLYIGTAAARSGDSATAYAAQRRLLAAGATERTKKLDFDLLLEEYDVVERDVRELLASSSMGDWGNGFWTYFMALRNQGRLAEATRFSNTGWLPGLPPLSLEWAPSATHQAIVALETGDARAAARFFELTRSADWTRWSPGVQSRYLSWWGTLRGMALAAAGDTHAVRLLADSVERWGRGSAFGRDQKAHHYLRGMLHVAAGRHEDAVQEFRAAVFSASLGFTRVNYEMGRCLLQLDRPREAVAILQPALRGALDASNLYVSRTELHELLAQAFDRAGERDSAAVHYRAVAQAWRRADAAYQGRRDKAVAWLSRRASVAEGTTR